ncbi:amino acid adenylation domain-containing protein [Kribbella sp. NPDC004536]|uniref:non-ribosomal peptide synthetase n=1 Tax=Kribbella sp. NPDC004536 TaxID=3364106 RepID=UPI0036CD5185
MSPGPLRLPASFAQERSWLVEQLVPSNGVYNVASATRIRGSLNSARLEASFRALVARHEVLRTGIETVGGDVQQFIHEDLPVDFEYVDHSADACAATRAAAARPFDIARPPLTRATLVQVDPEEHLLVITAHHAACDAWSAGILRQELSHLYAGMSLEPLPIRYADYALWQREKLSGQHLDDLSRYWRGRVGDAPLGLLLPLDHVRPAQSAFSGARETVVWESSLTAAVVHIARQEGATLFAALASVLAILLSRLTGQDDLMIGTVSSSRTRTELEPIIGYFANTLPLRVRLRSEDTFRSLLDRVTQESREALAHQDLPFEKIVELAGGPRKLPLQPLFQVMLVLHNEELPEIRLAGTECEPIDTGHVGAKFDLVLQVHPGMRGLTMHADYDTALLEASTVQGLLEEMKALLEQVSAEPDRPVVRLPITYGNDFQDPSVASGLLTRDDSLSGEGGIVSRFERFAAETPRAVAISATDVEVTYAELNTRADALARYLSVLGVRSEIPVAVCVARSIEYVVGILGVLKAGGAYVPLDPTDPHARIRTILDDLDDPIVLVHRPSTPGSPLVSARTVDLDEIPDVAPQLQPALVSSDQLAYIIYTSGSTGTPKGVLIPHRGLLRLVSDADYVRFGPEETVLQLTPTTFDVSGLEIWGALLNGGRVALFPDEPVTPEAIGRAIDKFGVTTAWLTSSLFNVVVDTDVRTLADLRQLLIGGEALSASHVARAAAELPTVRMVNGYGPTECSVLAVCYQIPSDFDATRSAVPIGIPIRETTAYVMDPSGNLCSEGEVGELYLGGLGVGRGYLNRPELTKAAFCPDPFSDVGSAMMYRTGDLVCRNADGTLEFRGRTDDQMKIRGHRVEIGEVEAAFSRLPGVQVAAVVPLPDGAAERSLCAFAVLDPEASPSIEDVRTGLAGIVPAYMIPGEIRAVSGLPLLANGKVDRKSLLAEHASSAATARDAPSGQLEELVRDMMAATLKRPDIGIDESFFECGGNSLLAIRLATRLSTAAGNRIGIATVFELRTARAIAGYLCALLEVAGAPGEPAQPGPDEEVVTL